MKSKPPRTPIFELTALEQRVLLSVNAPVGLSAHPVDQSFPPAITTNHPLTQMQLNWSDGGGAQSYTIWKSTDGLDFVQVGSTSDTQFVVNNLQPGNEYEFEVEAIGSDQSTADAYVIQYAAGFETEYEQSFANGDTSGISGGGALQNSNGPDPWWYSVSGGATGSATITLQNTPSFSNAFLDLHLAVLNDSTGTFTVSGPGKDITLNTDNFSQGYSEELDNDSAGTAGQPLGDGVYTVSLPFGSSSGGTAIFTITSNLHGTQAGWGLTYADVNLVAPYVSHNFCLCQLGLPQSQDPNASGGNPTANADFSSGSGDAGSSSSSGNNGPTDVNAATGSVTVSATDVSSNIPGMAQTRQWTSNLGLGGSGAVGNGAFSAQQPVLAQPQTGTMAITEAVNDVLWFDGSDSTGWVERFGGSDTLQHITSGPNANQYVLTNSLGASSYFNDLSSGSEPGQLVETIDGNGNITSYGYDTYQRLSTIARTVNGTTDTLTYSYPASGQTNLVSNVSLTEGGDGVVGQVQYAYYDGTTAGGNLGDLESVTTKDGQGNSTGTTFYRYYGPGAAAGGSGQPSGGVGDLEYVFTPDAYAVAMAHGINPATDNTDADLRQYASEYLVYYTPGNSSNPVNYGKVYSETLSGRGTYTFAYSTNPTHNATTFDGLDAWLIKSVETLPDGSTSTVYLNGSGEPVLKCFVDNSTGIAYPTFYKYDSAGSLLWTAHASAFVLSAGKFFNESYPDLINDSSGSSPYLSQNAGLIEGTDFYSSTAATSSTAGGVSGYIQDNYVRQGEAGTKILQESKDYISQTASGGQTIYEVADDSVYGTAGGDARVTRYQYQFASGTTQLQQETTIAPPIVAGQNGPATSTTDTANADTTTQVFDTNGRVIWQKDAGGFLSYNQYDASTGDLIKHIDDVNTADTGDFSNLPTGWSTPSGGGLELITSYIITYAGQGAIEPAGSKITETIAPNNAVSFTIDIPADNGFVSEERTYTGWHYDSVSQKYTTTGPVQITRHYLPAAGAPAGQQSVYNETLTIAAPLEATSSPSGQEPISSSNILSLSRDLYGAAGIAETDSYFSLAGVTYSAAVAQLGSGSFTSASGNYYNSVNSYDTEGRLTSVTDTTGTVTQYVLDGLGRTIEELIGTAPSRMTPVTYYWYDNNYQNGTNSQGGTGDGNLTEIDQKIGTFSADDVTLKLYDFRDRLIATKEGATLDPYSHLPAPSEETDNAHRLLTYYSIDNRDETIGTYTYAGDGVSMSDFATWTSSTDASKLRAYTSQSYDDQGREYQSVQYSVDPSSGAISLGLTTNTFRDHRGNVIETSNPGGLVYKHQFDGAGRDIKDSTTDGGKTGGAAQNWANAGTTANDIVIEQTLNTYDKASNLTETELRQRFDIDPDSAVGDLQGPGGGNPGSLASRDYFQGSYYDLANRQTDAVNVGTNGGVVWAMPSTVPARSDQVLVNHTDYNAAGLVQDTIDPAGIMTGTIYDLLGRRIETINAWDGTQNPTPTNATNQITTYTLNGIGDILTQTAVMPSGTPSQTTTYVYGVQPGGTMGSNIFSNTLLAKIEYPIPSGANAGQSDTTNASDWQQFAYDDQGQKIKFQDQNGTIHGYTLDVLGRLTADVITNFSTGVDQGVKSLFYNFNDAGLPFQQTTYNDTVPNGNGSDILSQVQNTYNGYGQLTAQYQSHSGPVNTSSTPKTQYVYDQSGNWSRLSNTVYPNTRGLVDDYGTSGLNYQISRVANQEDYYGAIQDYLYLGLNTIIRSTSFPWNIGLSYVKSTTESIGDAGDMYTGIDRFGRVVRQRWSYRTGLTGTGGGDTLGTVLEDVQYGYDRDGNVLYTQNNTNSNFSELFAYDQLNRLTSFQRGTLNSSDTAITTANPLTGSSNNWSLNAIGDITSAGGTSRTVNSQNQVTGVGSNTLTYDSNGNTLTDQAGNTYVYDAWNHIVSLNGTYAYKWDALGRKIYEGTSGHDLYYNTTGNVIEERNSSGTVTDQYVWGLMYQNQLILRDDNSISGNLGITGSGLGNRLYAMYDANFDITGMVDTSGTVQQRYVYDPYGTKTLLDGSYDTISTDTVHMSVGYQGGWGDAVSELVQFGARTYNPATGTWMQHDPAGYVNGSSLYAFVGENPVTAVDPSGLVLDFPGINAVPGRTRPDIPVSGFAAFLLSYLRDTGKDFIARDQWGGTILVYGNSSSVHARWDEATAIKEQHVYRDDHGQFECDRVYNSYGTIASSVNHLKNDLNPITDPLRYALAATIVALFNPMADAHEMLHVQAYEDIYNDAIIAHGVGCSAEAAEASAQIDFENQRNARDQKFDERQQNINTNGDRDFGMALLTLLEQFIGS